MESIKTSGTTESAITQTGIYPFSILEFDSELRCVQYNREGKDNFIGLESDFLVGRQLYELPLDKQTRSRFIEMFKKVSEANETLVFETLNIDGSEVKVYITPFAEQKSQPIKGFLTFTEVISKVEQQQVLTNDIANMKRLNQELIERSRLFQSVLNNIGDGVLAINSSGQFTIVNPAAENMLGEVPSSIDKLTTGKGFRIETFDRSRELSTLEFPLLRALSSEDDNQTELVMSTEAFPEGLELSVTTRQLRNSNGKLEGAVMVMRDVSKNRRAQEKLEEVNRNLDSFVQATAHDLKSPVTNMKNLFNLIERTGDPAKKKEISGKIRESVEQLDDLLGVLMEIVDAQKNENVGIDRLSFTETFHFIIDSLQEQIEEAQPRFTLNFETEHIVYNQAYLRSIFHNMLTNAIKYRSSERQLEISISTRKKGGYIMLSFEDNGIGMDLKKDKQHLFKPFKRLTSQGQGKGIGLNLIKSIVEKNGGEIKVQSTKGKGTTFFLYLHPYTPGNKQISLF